MKKPSCWSKISVGGSTVDGLAGFDETDRGSAAYARLEQKGVIYGEDASVDGKNANRDKARAKC
jgi:hypothetical protein